MVSISPMLNSLLHIFKQLRVLLDNYVSPEAVDLGGCKFQFRSNNSLLG